MTAYKQRVIDSITNQTAKHSISPTTIGTIISASADSSISLYNLLTANIYSKLIWDSIRSKPTTFTPSAHTHPIIQITGLQGELDNFYTISQIDSGFVDYAHLDQAQYPPTLDGSAHIQLAQMPNGIMQLKGNWDAFVNNNPYLSDGIGRCGDMWKVSDSGTVCFTHGCIKFHVGDYAIYNGTIWELGTANDRVILVNGMYGLVTIDLQSVTDQDTFTTNSIESGKNIIADGTIIGTNGKFTNRPYVTHYNDSVAIKSDIHTYTASTGISISNYAITNTGVITESDPNWHTDSSSYTKKTYADNRYIKSLDSNTTYPTLYYLSSNFYTKTLGDARYVRTETDPVYTASAASGITTTDTTNFRTAAKKYPAAFAFNTSTGNATITKNDATTLTASFDGRYLKSTGDTSTSTIAVKGSNFRVINPSGTSKTTIDSNASIGGTLTVSSTMTVSGNTISATGATISMQNANIYFEPGIGQGVFLKTSGASGVTCFAIECKGVDSSLRIVRYSGASIVDTVMTISKSTGAITYSSSIKTGAPNGAAQPIKMGGVTSGAVILDASNYWEVNINGVTKKVLIAQYKDIESTVFVRKRKWINHIEDFENNY